ncbi:MAG TPA: hypothetical protein VGE26_09040 [Sphingobacteriaceae bacterium]
MSNRLENFIRDNKKGFDLYEPPADLWSKIEAGAEDLETPQIQPKKEKLVKLSTVLRVAATVIVVMAIGIFFWQSQNTEAVNLSNINPELAKQQMHYASLIEIKRSELKRIEKEEPQLYQEFSSEIKKMDESYEKLKNDLPTSPNQEETVKAMIRNLQAQIQVLNQQLTIIQQINNYKNTQSNATTTL